MLGEKKNPTVKIIKDDIRRFLKILQSWRYDAVVNSPADLSEDQSLVPSTYIR